MGKQLVHLPTTMTPITQTLRTALREELRAHPILIWLDKDADYSAFVDELRNDPSNFPVIAHRGSYLESMMALEAHGSGIDPSPLLLHLPQANWSCPCQIGHFSS